jgi:hypothetical protein
MTELNYSLKACEMPEDDFVYLAEDVEALLEEKDKRIAELERELVKTKKAQKDDDAARERFEYGMRHGE